MTRLNLGDLGRPAVELHGQEAWAVVRAARLELAGLDRVVEATCCELAMAATLKSDGGVQGRRMCKALG